MTRTIKIALLNHEKFAQEMKTFGLTQEQIAEHLNISDRYIRKLKTKDRFISAQLLYRIHILFDKPMEYFLKIIEL